MVTVERLDHIVLTVASSAASCAFYRRVLGMRVATFDDGRKALPFGGQKTNLHERGREYEPKAARPTPGSADLCFITSVPREQVLAHLQAEGVPVLAGPRPRTGALRPLQSVSFRDPEGDLIEVANQPAARAITLPDRAASRRGSARLAAGVGVERLRAGAGRSRYAQRCL
jgi:catechol 2,3-dioxygenase-like lactoylglutathione lyase family enzyme